MQDTYNKSIGDLARAINGLEEMIKQQGRDVQYMKNNLRGQRSEAIFSHFTSTATRWVIGQKSAEGGQCHLKLCATDAIGQDILRGIADKVKSWAEVEKMYRQDLTTEMRPRSGLGHTTDRCKLQQLPHKRIKRL